MARSTIVLAAVAGALVIGAATAKIAAPDSIADVPPAAVRGVEPPSLEIEKVELRGPRPAEASRQRDDTKLIFMLLLAGVRKPIG